MRFSQYHLGNADDWAIKHIKTGLCRNKLERTKKQICICLFYCRLLIEIRRHNMLHVCKQYNFAKWTYWMLSMQWIPRYSLQYAYGLDQMRYHLLLSIILLQQNGVKSRYIRYTCSSFKCLSCIIQEIHKHVWRSLTVSYPTYFNAIISYMRYTDDDKSLTEKGTECFLTFVLEHLMIIMEIFFQFLHKSIYWGTSNEYLKHMFL